MRISRYLAVGFLTGWVLNLIFLILFPHFFGTISQLLIFPIAVSFLLGFLASMSGLVLRILRRAAGAVGMRVAFGARSASEAEAIAIENVPSRRRWRVVFFTLAAVTLLLYGLRRGDRAWSAAPTTAVFCVDAATWTVMDTLVEEGRLPNIEGIRGTGAWGILRSSEVSMSPVIWTTIATGVSPEQHGIHSFYASQRNLKAKRVWEILAEEGRTIGIFRWLVTWPPRTVPGFLIPGVLARDASSTPSRYEFVNRFRMERKGSDSVHPMSLSGYLLDFLRSGLRLETCLEIGREISYAKVRGDRILLRVAFRRAEIRLNRDVYAHLLREHAPEFTTFYDNGVDVLGHFYWKYMEPEYFPEVTDSEARRYGRVILDYYELVDEVLGDLIGHLDESTQVFVLSDHGQCVDPEAAGDRAYPDVDGMLQALGYQDEFYGVSIGARTYIESVSAQPAERRDALLDLEDHLAGAIRTANGEPLFHLDIEEGERLGVDLLDTGIDPNEDVRIAGITYPLRDWIETRPQHTGKHDPRGIILATGPGIVKNREIHGARIIDVGPTLLYGMGFPLSKELEGNALLEVFTPDFRATNPIAWIETYGPLSPELDEIVIDPATRKKLEALGYVR